MSSAAPKKIGEKLKAAKTSHYAFAFEASGFGAETSRDEPASTREIQAGPRPRYGEKAPQKAVFDSFPTPAAALQRWPSACFMKLSFRVAMRKGSPNSLVQTSLWGNRSARELRASGTICTHPGGSIEPRPKCG